MGRKVGNRPRRVKTDLLRFAVGLGRRGGLERVERPDLENLRPQAHDPQHDQDRADAAAHHGATGPNSQAVSPDSSPPRSFEATINTPLTADTRPRISSGVSICTNVWRTTTLMLSSAPTRNIIESDSQNHCEMPKTAVAAP